MSSREKILGAVRGGKPPAVPLPEPTTAAHDLQEIVQQFLETLKNIGATGILVKGWEPVSQFYDQYKGLAVLNGVGEIGERTVLSVVDSQAEQLDKLHAVFLRGRVGVAENGAIWIPESETGNRLLPFICEHLVLVISAAELVPTLREAYEGIEMKEQGYGVFIAGPSKSADIEQSLVIGAHGPLSLQVLIVG